jgi:hypothetical protein
MATITYTINAIINGTKTPTTLTPLQHRTLMSCGTSRQGAKPRTYTTPQTLTELQNMGLIGPGGGLTRRGTYAYMDVLDQMLS